MSSILKALEKVEQSQTGRRGGGPAGLARNAKRRAPWVLPVGILGGAAVAALATFAAMGGFSRHPAPTAQSKTVEAVTAPAAAVSQVTPASAAKVDQAIGAQQKDTAAAQVALTPAPAAGANVAKPAPAANAVAAPMTPAKVKAAPQAVAKSAPAASTSSLQAKPVPAAAPRQAKAASDHAKSASSVLAASASRDKVKPVASAKSDHVRHATADGDAARKRQPERVTQAERRAVASLPAPVQAAAPQAAPVPVVAPVPPEKAPELRVTGIAWQKDSHSSAAIINGRPVQQGGVVDGYKVEQIYEDKVRLSGKGGHVEVPLGGGE